jgi:hypothetical protein
MLTYVVNALATIHQCDKSSHPSLMGINWVIFFSGQ